MIVERSPVAVQTQIVAMEPVALTSTKEVAVKATFAIKPQSLAEQTLHVKEKAVAPAHSLAEAGQPMFATQAEWILLVLVAHKVLVRESSQKR